MGDINYGVVLVSVAMAVAIAVAVLAKPGVNDEQAVSVLTDEGYSAVRVTDRGLDIGFSGCGADDDVYYRARATNPRGSEVGVTVCCAWLFKGCTVRSSR